MLDYKVSDDRWKEELRKEIVTAITGSPLEKIKAFGQVGYYYKCHAPATIYKYFRDDQRSLEAVKCNKLSFMVTYSPNVSTETLSRRYNSLLFSIL